MEELTKLVECLIKKASVEQSAVGALQYSQAACNAANAIAQMQIVLHGQAISAKGKN
jgi:hypothetical protein